MRNRTAKTVAAAAFAAVGVASLTLAAEVTWLGTTGDWNSGSNWSSGAAAGNNSGALGSSVDAAVFTGTPPATVVAVDADRNIQSVRFQDITLPIGGSTTAFVIGNGGPNGGNPLFLSPGGTIQTLDSVFSSGADPVLCDINAPLRLAGATYTFTHNAGSAADTLPGLRIFGNVTSVAGVPTTLTLDGDHGTQSSSRAEFQGAISDGAGGAVVGVVKNGPGTWEMNQDGANPNTYTGDTIINGGILRSSSVTGFNGLGAFSRNSNYIINAGGTLRNSVAGATVRSVTINTGGTLNVSTAAATTLNFASESGPSLHFNYVSSGAGTFATNLPVRLIGAVAGEGGVKLSSGPDTGHTDIGGTTSTFDLGAVARTFDIGKGNALNSYDLRIRGPVVGGGPDGGIIKTGPGTLRFDNATSTFTGRLEIRQGEVRINADNAFTGLPELLIAGGNLHVFGGVGGTQTFGPVTMTKGSTTAGSSVTSTIRAPSFTLNVATGDTVSVATVLADATGPATVTKTGAGVATFTGNNTYTGLTTVAGGALSVNTNAEDVILTGSAGVNITGGRLIFDYTGGTSPATTIVPILDAGYDVNFATGQIRSSTATASLGLGYRDDGAGNFVVAYTRYGDANLDRVTNIADFSALAANFNLPGVWSTGDFNYDGSVGIADFSLLAANFNLTAPLEAARGAVVPEPAAATVLALAAFCTSVRRRRG